MFLPFGNKDENAYGEIIQSTSHRYRYFQSAFPQPLQTLPMMREVAFQYMRGCMQIDVRMRVRDAHANILYCGRMYVRLCQISPRQSTIGENLASHSRRHVPVYDLVT